MHDHPRPTNPVKVFVRQEDLEGQKPSIVQEIQKKALQNYLDEEDRKLDKLLNHCTKCGRSSLAVVISPKGICTHCITAEATNYITCQWPGRCGEIAKFGEYCYAHMLLDQHAERKEPIMNGDPVNSPSHYTSHPSGVEVIQITEHMGFCLGNVVKYVLRADHKGNAIEDLKKAAWYLTREIQRRESE